MMNKPNISGIMKSNKLEMCSDLISLSHCKYVGRNLLAKKMMIVNKSIAYLQSQQKMPGGTKTDFSKR